MDVDFRYSLLSNAEIDNSGQCSEMPKGGGVGWRGGSRGGYVYTYG